MKTSKTILVRAYRSQEDYTERRGCDVEFDYDTIAEAKAKAKHYLTDAYQHSAEMSSPLTYSQVVIVRRNEPDEIHSDFFRP